jgi:hypothetical protein
MLCPADAGPLGCLLHPQRGHQEGPQRPLRRRLKEIRGAEIERRISDSIPAIVTAIGVETTTGISVPAAPIQTKTSIPDVTIQIPIGTTAADWES